MHCDVLKDFNTVSLERLTALAPLDRRFETKFILTVKEASAFLNEAMRSYDLLRVNGDSISAYENHYFDTACLSCYFQHHNSRANRFKIRLRYYRNTQTTMYELKQKLNTGQTVKWRRRHNDERWQEILNQHAIGKFTSLQESIQINYNRITLLHRENHEKLTLDYNYCCSDGRATGSYNNVVFAEVKTPSRKPAALSAALKPIQPGALSKYCLGLISLKPGLKYNNFKPAFRQILIANNHG